MNRTEALSAPPLHSRQVAGLGGHASSNGGLHAGDLKPWVWFIALAQGFLLILSLSCPNLNNGFSSMIRRANQ